MILPPLSLFLPSASCHFLEIAAELPTTHAHANTHARTLHVRLACSSLLFSLLGPSVSGCVPPSSSGLPPAAVLSFPFSDIFYGPRN